MPFKITASVEAEDPEKDKLTYVWNLGGTKKETTEPTITHTFEKAGDYDISVEVLDDKKATVKSNLLLFMQVMKRLLYQSDLTGNQTFYFPGKPVAIFREGFG